ncbi:MFS transporter [Thalassotalea agarivorans]|nr:MFS transporter [Thalassotalea agarivorans]
MKITNKYLVETLVFLSYVLFAMAWVGGTASMDQIMRSMDVDSLASASFISGAVTLAKIVGTFAAAWLAVKLGVKYAFFVSCLLIFVGIITPVAPNYELLLVSRFLMGLGGAFMIVYFNPIVMQWFDAKERPIVNGLNAVAFNVGTAIILWFMADINAMTGDWQWSLIAFSIATLALAMVWILVSFEKADDQSGEQQAQTYSYAEGLKDRFNWAYALTYSGILAFYICLFTFYPKAGISESKWVIGFGIIGTIAGIIYSKYITQRVPVIRWSGLVITISVVGLSFAPNPLMQTISAMVLGFFVFFPITALVTLPYELKGMHSARLTVVFSLFYSISYLLATFILWLFGKLADSNGDYASSFLLIAIVSSTFFFGSFFLPETNKAEE